MTTIATANATTTNAIMIVTTIGTMTDTSGGIIASIGSDTRVITTGVTILCTATRVMAMKLPATTAGRATTASTLTTRFRVTSTTSTTSRSGSYPS